jgi:hypothetical protein
MTPRTPHDATRVALDELIALSALAHGASLARQRRAVALRSGTSSSRWRGRGVDFRESRIYQPGDEIRHMDWRVTARSGKPHTKLFEEEREQALLLALDLNPSMRFGTRARFKNVQAARAAALLAWMASAAGDRVGALGFGGGVDGEVKPAGGRRGVLRTLRAMRDWDHASDLARSEPLSRALTRMRRLLRPGMRIVLFTDGFSADADAVLPLPQLAARHEIAVVLLRDALELAAPPPGRYAVHLGMHVASSISAMHACETRGRNVSPLRAGACSASAASLASASSNSTPTPTCAAHSRRCSRARDRQWWSHERRARCADASGCAAAARHPSAANAGLVAARAGLVAACGIVVVAILVLARVTRRRLRTRRWHMRVRGELDRIAASHAAQADPVRVAADVSRLLRRASLRIAPNAAALHGDAWLDFLDAQFPPDEAQRAPFRGGRAGRALLDLQYRRDDAAAADDAKTLLELARRWLDHALKAGPAHV